MMGDIKWTTRPQLAIANIQAMRRAFLLSAELPIKLAETHKTIENIAKANVTDDKLSTRNPQATKRSIYNFDQRVAQNITSSIKRTKRLLVGGTGDTSYMDQNDPLVTFRNPSNTEVRLWRILEWGVDAFKNIKAQNPNKPMVFYWRRIGQLFIGKPFRAPYTEAIDHPGQRGRFYWEKTKFDTEKIFQVRMRLAMSIIVARYSGR